MQAVLYFWFVQKLGASGISVAEVCDADGEVLRESYFFIGYATKGALVIFAYLSADAVGTNKTTGAALRRSMNVKMRRVRLGQKHCFRPDSNESTHKGVKQR